MGPPLDAQWTSRGAPKPRPSVSVLISLSSGMPNHSASIQVRPGPGSPAPWSDRCRPRSHPAPGTVQRLLAPLQPPRHMPVLSLLLRSPTTLAFQLLCDPCKCHTHPGAPSPGGSLHGLGTIVMVTPSFWGLELYLSCTSNTVARKAPPCCPCVHAGPVPLHLGHLWEAPGCPLHALWALPCIRAGHLLLSVSASTRGQPRVVGASQRGGVGGPGIAVPAIASGTSSLLSACLQLCVQKLRILIEDSDQNRKALPVGGAVCVLPGRRWLR